MAATGGGHSRRIGAAPAAGVRPTDGAPKPTKFSLVGFARTRGFTSAGSWLQKVRDDFFNIL